MVTEDFKKGFKQGFIHRVKKTRADITIDENIKIELKKRNVNISQTVNELLKYYLKRLEKEELLDVKCNNK